MMSALLRVLLAGLIALGIVAYVTNGDIGQVGRAVASAYDHAFARKEKLIAAKNASPEAAATESDAPINVVTKRSIATPMASERSRCDDRNGRDARFDDAKGSAGERRRCAVSSESWRPRGSA